MIVELDVPRGTRLLLLDIEIQPNPTARDELVWAVAVYRDATDGMVLVHGHVCGAEGECARGWCFEAKVLVAAIRANLDGAR
ncbi:hypothetical protein [Micromonospora sp. U21]|uniref:hypothetical protein n=1 Tax=Micromonospora sp. U21 TaxID=2824899 RepID=UPI001B36C70B|nr:hypothetical protein [Micromonospora sp. U21]MBQ0900979.1 hypothetical protein [Micromonospora sp. U21]